MSTWERGEDAALRRQPTISHCVCVCACAWYVAAAYSLSAHSMHISFLIVCVRAGARSHPTYTTTADGYKCFTQSWTQWEISFPVSHDTCVYRRQISLSSNNIGHRVHKRRHPRQWGVCSLSAVYDYYMCNFVWDSSLRFQLRRRRDTNANTELGDASHCYCNDPLVLNDLSEWEVYTPTE